VLDSPAMTTGPWTPCISAMVSRMVCLSLRPAIVVNSPGTGTIAKFPIIAQLVDTIFGCQANGNFIWETQNELNI